MQLQNFECQIAKAQIGRYIAGDALSDEALTQLEAHVSKCAECRQNLAERRAVLLAMLSPGEASSSTSESEKPNRTRFDLAQFIKSKVQANQSTRAVVRAEAKPTTFTKPAIYSLGLGIVLVGMSYLSRNMGSLLGPKAAETTPSSTSSPQATAPTVSQQTADPSDLPLTPPKPSTVTPKTPAVYHPESHIQVAVKKDPEATSKPKPSHRRHRAPRSDSKNRIRVYGPEN